MADSKWLDRYREGSYRGARFFMDSHSMKFGRKKVVHEFPGRDDSETEDLGKLSKRFSLNIYILADDYFSERDTLVEEIENNKNGLLVHPYLGSYIVQITSSELGEVFNQGRMVRFSIDAIQDSEKILTKTIVDTKVNILDKRTTLLQSVNDFFLDAYKFTQGPIDVVNKIIATIDTGIDTVNNAKKVVQSVASYQSNLNRMKARADFLVFNAEDLFLDMKDLIIFGADVTDDTIDEISDLTSPVNSKRQFFEMKNVLDVNDGIIDLDDVNSVIDTMINLNALATMSGLVATIEYVSEEEAEDLINFALEYIDRFEEDSSITDDLKYSLRSMREALFFDVETRTDGLGVKYEYKITGESENSLVIANSIYGNIDKEQDVIDMNGVQEPFFIGGSITAVVNNE